MASQLTVGKTAMMVARICCFSGYEIEAPFLSNLYIYPSDTPETVDTKSCCGTPSLLSGKKVVFSWYNDATNQKIADIGSSYIESNGFAMLAVPITETVYSIYKENFDTYGAGNFAIKAEIYGVTTISASKILGMTIIPATTNPTDPNDPNDPVEHEANYYIDYMFSATTDEAYTSIYNSIVNNITDLANDLSTPFKAATGMDLKYVYCVKNDTKKVITIRVTTYNPNVDNPTLMPLIIIAPIVWKILVALIVVIAAAAIYYFCFLGQDEGEIPSQTTPNPSPTGEGLENLAENNTASDLSQGVKEGGMIYLACTLRDMSKNWATNHKIDDVDKCLNIVYCCFVVTQQTTAINDTCFQKYVGYTYSSLSEAEKNDFGHLQDAYLEAGLYADAMIMELKGMQEQADALRQAAQQLQEERDALRNSSSSESDLYNGTGEAGVTAQETSDGIWRSFTDDGSGCAFEMFDKCIITDKQAKTILIGTMVVSGFVAFSLIKSIMPTRK